MVESVKKGKKNKQPAPPFITSTLQQEASRKLGFQAKRTMKAAQELYEGVDIEGMGAVGLITYMRTDSLRISEDAVQEAVQFIGERWGKQYLPSKPRHYKARATHRTVTRPFAPPPLHSHQRTWNLPLQKTSTSFISSFGSALSRARWQTVF